MILRNRNTLVPVLIWTALCTGLMVLALFQERTGIEAVPLLSLQNVFAWVGSLMLLYLVLIWPLSLERLIDRFARQPLSQEDFAVHSVQEPLLLVLYVLPVLVLSVAFGFKGTAVVFQILLVQFAVGFLTWSHFRLGYFFHGSMAKSYYMVAGVLCVLSPALNVFFPVFYGKSPAWLSHLNPFFTLFHLTGPGNGLQGPVLTLFFVFFGLSILLLGVPFVMAIPPRVYKDLPGS
jgi:hypothetical protein